MDSATPEVEVLLPPSPDDEEVNDSQVVPEDPPQSFTPTPPNFNPPMSSFDTQIISDFDCMHKVAQRMFEEFKSRSVTDFPTINEPSANLTILQSFINLTANAFLYKHSYRQTVVLGLIGIPQEITTKFSNVNLLAEFIGNIMPSKICFNATHNRGPIDLHNIFVIFRGEVLNHKNETISVFIVMHQGEREGYTKLNTFICSNFLQAATLANYYIVNKNGL
ncbi:unnamed protein product, partial [Rotaria socialis]